MGRAKVHEGSDTGLDTVLMKYVILTLALVVSLGFGPYVLWYDWQEENWFMVSVDLALIVMWFKYLWSQR